MRVTTLGLANDAICDVKHHGGVDQAVYVYGQADYDWWTAELGHELEPGTFGENLTVSKLESATLAVGDRLHLAEVVLEVTSPRIPCVTLAARMGDPAFAKRFRQAAPGVYCRVIREGDVRAGSRCGGNRIAARCSPSRKAFATLTCGKWDEAMIRRHLAVPIAVRDRVELEERLAALAASDHPVNTTLEALEPERPSKSEQCAYLCQDFVHGVGRQSADEFCLSTSPIQRFHLIAQNHSLFSVRLEWRLQTDNLSLDW